MRRALLSALIVLAAVAPGRAVPKAGENVPGAFHAYNVNGAHRGRYHCPVTDYDLDPVVLLVHRGTEDSEGFKALREKLDAAIGKNTAARLRGVVVVLHNDLPDVRSEEHTSELQSLRH